MSWKRKELITLVDKKGTVKKKGKPKKGYVSIEMDNGDVGEYFEKYSKIEVGDSITYDIKKAEMMNGSDESSKFNTNSFVNVKLNTMDTKTPIRSLRGIDEKRLLFIDIECVSSQETIERGTSIWDAWEYKHRKENFDEDQQYIDLYKQKAGLYAEFGKIVCISIGYLAEGELNVKSFYGDDEKNLLIDFFEMITVIQKRFKSLVGFASNQYDIPFIIKRAMINGLPVPDMIDVSGMKPWELVHIDLKEHFKLTGWEVPSLPTLAHCFGIPSSKGGEVEGYNLSEYYYSGKKGVNDNIMKYCEDDIWVTCNIFLKMTLQEPLEGYTSKTNQ